MGKNLWWVTRPTRDLHDLEEALKCFAKIAEGKRWRGNRELHQRFEVENPAKTGHSGTHGSRGSGGRTWAAWLKSWGMWYDDECVTITDAGKLIINAKTPAQVHDQIKHMIMTFQITSAYHERLKPKQDSDFQIFPFRFMWGLLLDKDVQYLHVDEIGLFLLQVKKPSEHKRVVSKITDWRKTADDKKRRERMDRLIANHREKYRVSRTDSPEGLDGYWRSIKDIANTLAVNMSYMTELRYDNRDGTIRIRKKDVTAVRELLKKYDDMAFSRLYEYSEATFMRRFGMRYDRRKASKKATRPMTPAKKQYKQIMETITKLRQIDDMSTGTDLLKKIQEGTNYPIEVISKILADNPDLAQPQDADNHHQHFESHYLNCAIDGEQHREFENLTRKIFAMMGFETKKMRIPKTNGGSPEIDGLILNKEVGLSGLLECKGGGKYSFPIGDCEKMKNVYIKNFRTKKINGNQYCLDFVVYVVGNAVSGLNNFDGIIRDAKIRGSVIYARDLLKIYSAFTKGHATQIKIWSLFKSNIHLMATDIDEFLKT